jgi:SAM-dependent methyltransferase
VLIPPSIEREHVHAVYDTIADHWDGTRYAPWPRVVEFIRSLEFGSLIADVGCGNGKYMQPTYIGRPVAVGRGMIGCDMSKNLIQICGQRNFNALVCDGLLLPYRSNSYDAAISIAVGQAASGLDVALERRRRAGGELAGQLDKCVRVRGEGDAYDAAVLHGRTSAQHAFNRGCHFFRVASEPHRQRRCGAVLKVHTRRQ